MKLHLFIFFGILLLNNLIFGEEVSNELIEEGKNKVIEIIYDLYGGISFDISFDEKINNYLVFDVTQIAYGYPIDPLFCSFSYDTETSEVKKLFYDTVTNTLIGNLYERYSDDVVDPFDVKELVKGINRIKFNDTYTLDFDTITIEERKNRIVHIENLPFPEDYNVVTAQKQYTLVDDNLVEASYSILKVKNFYYGGYSKKDITNESFDVYLRII